MLKSNTNRHNTFKFYENRLIFKASPIEVVNKRIQALYDAYPENQDDVEKALDGLKNLKIENEKVQKIVSEALEKNNYKINQSQLAKLESLFGRLSTVQAVEETKESKAKPTETTTPIIKPKKPEVTKISATPSTPKEEKSLVKHAVDGAKSFIKGTGDILESATDAVYPKKWTEHMSRNKKIAVGALSTGLAVIVGKWVYESGKAIANRFKGSARAGEEASKKIEQKGGGKLKKLLTYGTVIAGTLLGGHFFIKYLDKKYGLGITEKLGWAEGKAKDAGMATVEEIREMFTKENPWIQYGVKEEPYKNAVKAYQDTVYGSPNSRDAGIQKIRAMLLENGATKEQCDAFTQDMDERYAQKHVPEAPGITYVHPTVALQNYAKNIETTAQQFVYYIRDHWAETAAITLIAHQLGIDVKLFRATSLTATQAKEIAVKMGKASVRHPLISLFLLGGSAVALHRLIRTQGKNPTYLPENLVQLFSVCKSNFPVSIGDLGEEARKQIASMREYAKSIQEIGTDYAQWIAEQAGDLASQLLNEDGPEIVGLTPNETNEVRNTASIEKLELDIVGYLAFEQTSSGTGNGEYIEKLQLALEKLRTFKAAYIQERCEEFTTNSTPELLLKDLETALKDIGVSLTLRNGIVQWQSENMKTPLDLCADPSLHDANAFHERSIELYRGEGPASLVAERTLQHLREILQNNGDNTQKLMKALGLPPASKALAMPIGSFLYVFDLDNLKEYSYALLSPVAPIFSSEETWSEYGGKWGASVGTGAITTAMVALNAEAFSIVKRAIVGGGRLGNPRMNWLGKSTRITKNIGIRITPGLGHVKLAQDAYYGSKDFVIVGRSMREATRIKDLPRKWWRGKYINSVLSKAGIRPEWIPIVEYGDYDQLNNIWGKLGRTNPPDVSANAFRKDVKKEIFDRMELVSKREITTKNYGTRIVKGGRIGNLEGIYKDTLRLITKKPHTTTGADIKAWRTVLAKFDTVTPKEVCQLLREARDTHGIKVSSRTLFLIEQSNSAKGILTGAVKSGDALEVARALNLAKKAAMLRTIGNVTGGTLDALGLAMAFIDWQENNRNIELAKQTNNAALLDLYNKSKVLIATEGAASAVGLAIGTTAIIGTATGYGALAGIATTGGLIMLPIGVAVAVGGIGYRGFKGAAETWQYEKDDWAIRKTNGELFAELEIQKPGGGRFWQRATTVDENLWNAFTKSPEDYSKWREEISLIEQANEGTRFHITGAIVEKMTPKPQPEENESKDMKNLRILEWQQNIADQMLYISRITHGKFDSVNADVFASARNHAELMAYSRTLRENSICQTIDVKHGKTKKLFNLADYAELTGKEHAEWAGTVRETYRKQIKIQNLVEQLNLIKEQTKEKAADTQVMHTIIQTSLLSEIEPYIAKLDSKIERYNFPGLGDGWEKDSTRVVLANMLRKELRKEADKLIKMDEISPEKYDEATQNLKSFLSDPVKYYGIEAKVYNIGIKEFRKSSWGDYKFREKNPAQSLFFIAMYGEKIGGEWWYRESTLKSGLEEVEQESTRLTNVGWLAGNLYVPEIDEEIQSIKLNTKTEDPPESNLNIAA